MPGEAIGSRSLHRLQDRLLRLLGSEQERRPKVVQAMLHRDANESVSYWLQLVVSIGIATLTVLLLNGHSKASWRATSIWWTSRCRPSRFAVMATTWHLSVKWQPWRMTHGPLPRPRCV